MPTPTTTQAMPIAILAVESSTCSISRGASWIATIGPGDRGDQGEHGGDQALPEAGDRGRDDQQHHDDVDDRSSADPPGTFPDACSPQVRQVEEPPACHGSDQPPSVQQHVDQTGGEAPDEQVGDLEGGPDEAAGMPHLAPVRADRPAPRPAPWPPRRSPRVHRPDLAGFAPVGQHRDDQEPGRRQVEIRAATPPAAPTTGSRPVSSAPSRRAAAIASSPGSVAPPGKAGWPACDRMVAARSVSSRSGPGGPVAEQHQHRTVAGARRREAEPACPADPAVPRRRRRPPTGATRPAGARRPPAAARRTPSGAARLVCCQARRRCRQEPARPRPTSASRCSRSGPTTSAAAASGSVVPIAVGGAQRRQEAGPACRPFRRGTPAGRGRSPGRRTRSTAPAAAACSARSSILTGSVCSVSPQRVTSRLMWVSTVIPGTPNACPAPRSRSCARTRAGSPARPASAAPRRRTARPAPGRGRSGTLDLFRKNPVDLISSSSSARGRRRVVGGRPEPGEQRRRHHVHPHVGGLRRQDGRHRQFQRVAEVEFAVRVRVTLRQAGRASCRARRVRASGVAGILAFLATLPGCHKGLTPETAPRLRGTPGPGRNRGRRDVDAR